MPYAIEKGIIVMARPHDIVVPYPVQWVCDSSNKAFPIILVNHGIKINF